MSDEAEWVLVRRKELKRAAEVLEGDGDEHGVGRDLLSMLAAAPQPPARMASIPESSPNGWLQAGGLLYRLTEGHRPENRDEINVTMVHGSRDPAHCEARAAEILAMLQSQQQHPAEAQPDHCTDHQRHVWGCRPCEEAAGKFNETAEAQPVAWMRRCAFDRVDVLTLAKSDRPRGWNMHAVTENKALPDDVPLYAAPPSAPVGAAEEMVLDAIERRAPSAPVGVEE